MGEGVFPVFFFLCVFFFFSFFVSIGRKLYPLHSSCFVRRWIGLSVLFSKHIIIGGKKKKKIIKIVLPDTSTSAVGAIKTDKNASDPFFSPFPERTQSFTVRAIKIAVVCALPARGVMVRRNVRVYCIHVPVDAGFQIILLALRTRALI